jgi:hypothetical protein
LTFTSADRERVLGFYRQHSPITDPGPHEALFRDVPGDVASIVRVVQGLLMHPAAAKLYGEPPEPDNPGWGERRMADLLARIVAANPAPLGAARPPAQRLRANCRNFAVLCVSMLRHHGVPARRRTGFARYLPGRHAYVHEVAEYWHVGEGRWVLVDPQNDDVTIAAQRAFFESIGQPERAAYDTLDITGEHYFMLGGAVWRRCRAGDADPDDFRSSYHRGLPEIQWVTLQDFDSLNKAELLGNESGFSPEEPLTAERLAFVDQVAALTVRADEYFDELRALFAATPYGRWVDARLASPGAT